MQASTAQDQHGLRRDGRLQGGVAHADAADIDLDDDAAR